MRRTPLSDNQNDGGEAINDEMTKRGHNARLEKGI